MSGLSYGNIYSAVFSSLAKISTEFLNCFLSSYMELCVKNLDKRKNISLIKFFTNNANKLSAKLTYFIT